MVVDLRSVLPPEAGELGLQALHELGVGGFGEGSGVHLAVAVSGTHVVDGEIVYAPTVEQAITLALDTRQKRYKKSAGNRSMPQN